MSKGQGVLEYLIYIGAAVIVAVTVIMVVVDFDNERKAEVESQFSNPLIPVKEQDFNLGVSMVSGLAYVYIDTDTGRLYYKLFDEEQDTKTNFVCKEDEVVTKE